MAGLGFSDKVSEYSKDFDHMESIIGKGLRMPFNNTNAGANLGQYIQ